MIAGLLRRAAAVSYSGVCFVKPGAAGRAAFPGCGASRAAAPPSIVLAKPL